MSRCLLAGCEVEADEAATRSWYARGREWDCSCGHCRNFLAAADRLPPQLLELLDRLGVPPRKATYVCEIYHEDDRLYYQVGYRLAGRILHQPECPRPEPWGLQGCSAERWVPFEAPDFPEPGFDLDLWLWLPWVLNEPIGGAPAED